MLYNIIAGHCYSNRKCSISSSYRTLYILPLKYRIKIYRLPSFLHPLINTYHKIACDSHTHQNLRMATHKLQLAGIPDRWIMWCRILEGSTLRRISTLSKLRKFGRVIFCHLHSLGTRSVCGVPEYAFCIGMLFGNVLVRGGLVAWLVRYGV